MKLTKISAAVVSLISAGIASDASAIELYVDSKTQQIYAQPGPGRVKLGTFEKVEEQSKAQKEELTKIHEELEAKDLDIKALEEKYAAARETTAKNDEKWFNKISLRGYTQMRYNQPLTGDRINGDPELRSVMDSGIKDNSNFTFRRVRLVFSGDITDYMYLYIQPDFSSSTPGGGNGSQNFAQLRDAYVDIAFDKPHEYRIRAGQSKVPFGWENLQSSQNRIALDRDDALNSAVPSERDLGLFAYWSPSPVQKLWKDLSKKGLKTSGDYGVLGVGVYNGQGINNPETNDDIYVVAHSTYPLDLGFLGKALDGQILEVGADAISGRVMPTLGAYVPYGSPAGTKSKTPTMPVDGVMEQRVGVHAVLFPQPFGLQAEWNWGNGPTLNVDKNVVEEQSLNGGYVQAMYKFDRVFGTQGTMIPYVKWQTFKGAWKAATNAPAYKVDEWDFGLEWQFNKSLELTAAYALMDRTNVNIGTSPSTSQYLGQASGDVLRMQLQWNY